MKKVFAVSVVAAACVFAANAGAEEGKSGFYLTGKAGASVVSLSDQRFLSGDEEETSKYKGTDDFFMKFYRARETDSSAGQTFDSGSQR
ncbi:hypothetical protein FGAF163_40080 [Escherichia coli]|nr:hypothetical protein FGAF163_40080 [Escherichia coli]